MSSNDEISTSLYLPFWREKSHWKVHWNVMVLVMVIVIVMVMVMAMDRKNQRRCRIWNPSSKLFSRHDWEDIISNYWIIHLFYSIITSSAFRHPFIPSSFHPFIPYRLGKLWLFHCWNFSLPQPFFYNMYASFRVSQLHWEISWSTRFSPDRPDVDVFDQGFQQFAISYFQYNLN